MFEYMCTFTCDYSTFLDRGLKEQFTVGLRSKETQLRLLSKEHSLEESIQLIFQVSYITDFCLHIIMFM